MTTQEPHVANHYTHFLRRLDRVTEGHLELAMALYTDHELLKLVLERAKVPEGVDRVAIALGPVHEGPYVVVTRSGAFVTCLGEHMRPKNLFVVSREELEAAGNRLDRMREHLDRITRLRQDPSYDGLDWLSKIDLKQPSLAREDIAQFVRWDALIGHTMHTQYVNDQEVLQTSWKDIACMHASKHTSLDESLLRAWWNLFWQASNLHVIANIGEVHDRCERYDVVLESSGIEAGCLSSTWGTANKPFVQTTARAIWASMQHVGPVLDSLEKLDLGSSFRRMIHDGTLAAIAMGSRSGRPRALRCLTRARDRFDFSDAFDAEIKPILREGIRDPERALDQFTLQAQELVAAERGGDPRDIPGDVARALAITGAADWNVDPMARQQLAHALPWLAAADASELFVPRAWVRSIPYSKERALALGRSMGRIANVGRPTPVRRAATPERNERCACGSGQKYKRCCMRAPMRIAA